MSLQNILKERIDKTELSASIRPSLVLVIRNKKLNYI